MTAAPREGGLSRSLEAGSVALVVALAVAIHVPALGDPLVGSHGFRMTQTAYPALLYARDGIDLLHPRLPVLGPPYEVPFEFPIVQAAGAILSWTGLSVDAALRIIALGSFAATAVLLWALVRRIADGRAAVVAVAAFCLSPLALYWSHAPMIEYPATAASLAFVLASWRAGERPSAAGLALVLGLGALGALVKITTWVFWIPLALAPSAAAGRPRLRPLIGLAACVAVAGIAGVWWTAYADSIKAASPWTSPLTSASVASFTFGTPALRTDPGTYASILTSLGLLVVGVPGAVLLVPAAAETRSLGTRLEWLGVALAAAGPMLVLFGLYERHDYYLIAVSPAWAALVGLGASAAVRRRPRWRPWVAAVLVASVVVGVPYWSLAFRGPIDPAHELAQAAELDRLSPPGEDVVVEGDDWSPEILYYARRTGYALPLDLTAAQRAALPATGVHVFLVSHPAADRTELLRLWPWTGVAGEYTYLVGSSRDAVAAAPIVADDAAPDEASAPWRSIACDGSRVGLALTGDGATIEVAPAAPTARLWLLDGLAPVPARARIEVRSGAGALSVGCAGADAVRIRSTDFAPGQPGTGAGPDDRAPARAWTAGRVSA